MSKGKLVKEEKRYQDAVRTHDSNSTEHTLDAMLGALRDVKNQRQKAVKKTAEVIV
ncbi:hypothetical protein GOV11_00890 [Candidatus Woesearchaeota archaeon]|nr:hypothetical protein [Candidatus Woesearchaeota archaeon]